MIHRLQQVCDVSGTPCVSPVGEKTPRSHTVARPVPPHPSPHPSRHNQLLFLVIVTPIMHAFWDLPASSPEQLNDIINVRHLGRSSGGSLDAGRLPDTGS